MATNRVKVFGAILAVGIFAAVCLIYPRFFRKPAEKKEVRRTNAKKKTRVAANTPDQLPINNDLPLTLNAAENQPTDNIICTQNSPHRNDAAVRNVGSTQNNLVVPSTVVEEKLNPDVIQIEVCENPTSEEEKSTTTYFKTSDNRLLSIKCPKGFKIVRSIDKDSTEPNAQLQNSIGNSLEEMPSHINANVAELPHLQNNDSVSNVHENLRNGLDAEKMSMSAADDWQSEGNLQNCTAHGRRRRSYIRDFRFDTETHILKISVSEHCTLSMCSQTSRVKKHGKLKSLFFSKSTRGHNDLQKERAKCSTHYSSIFDGKSEFMVPMNEKTLYSLDLLLQQQHQLSETFLSNQQDLSSNISGVPFAHSTVLQRLSKQPNGNCLKTHHSY